MNKEIREYMLELDRLLSENPAAADLEVLLTKIKFYQHERLVHLVVTMTMSLLTIIVACAMFMVADEVIMPFAALFILFLVLTAAYIRHYYKLENNVQKLYRYYDKLREKSANVN